MPKKILIVLTSHDQLGDTGRKTGYWLEELAVPYYTFTEAGAEITIASPNGGTPPVDPFSLTDEQQNDTTRRFLEDEAAQELLAASARLNQVNADTFDAIFYPGGHGPVWDLLSDENSIRLIEDFWAADKPVGAVCHGSIVLANAKDKSGEYIVRNRNVAGFTNDEEAAVDLTDVVPVLVEDILVERGAKFTKAGVFEPHVQTDGKLVTGQNPPSSDEAAAELLKLL